MLTLSHFFSFLLRKAQIYHLRQVLATFLLGWLNAMTKSDLGARSFALSYRSNSRVHNGKAGLAASSQSGNLGDHIFNHKKQEAKRVNRKWGRTLKAHSQWCTFSSKAPPRTMLPTKDQVFKHISLWGTFLIQSTISHFLESIGSWHHPWYLLNSLPAPSFISKMLYKWYALSRLALWDVCVCVCVPMSLCVSMCESVCVSVPVCVSLCVSLFLCVCVSVSVCMSMFLCVSVCLCVCVTMCLCVCVSVSVFLCVCVHIYVCVCVPVCVCVSLSVCVYSVSFYSFEINAQKWDCQGVWQFWD